MSLYHDPGRSRANLIAGLMSVPAKPGLEPMENQLTHALVWLLDSDLQLARAFGRLFLDDEGALGALCAARAIGAVAQVALPGGRLARTLFPDLSLTTDARALQLLVEVKPGYGGFHDYVLDGRAHPQAEAYAWAWSQRPPAGEARQRWVGTLTAGYDRPRDLDALLAGLPVRRARDVTWREVDGLLGQLEDELRPEVRFVARDLREVLRERVLDADHKPPPGELAELLDRGARLLAAVRERLPARLVRPRSHRRMAEYVGAYLDIDIEGAQAELWVHVSPRGGSYNVRGQPDALIVVGSKRGARPAEWGERFVPAGFVWSVDRAAYRGYRAFRTAEDIWPAGVDPGAAADEVAGWLLALVDAIRNPGTPSGT